MNYEAYFAELTSYENRILQGTAEDRAIHFARGYFRFYFQSRVGRKPNEEELLKAIEVLVPWFQDNPKRLIPDPQVMFEIAPLGKPNIIHNSMYGFYLNALDRDYKEVTWRK